MLYNGARSLARIFHELWRERLKAQTDLFKMPNVYMYVTNGGHPLILFKNLSRNQAQARTRLGS